MSGFSIDQPGPHASETKTRAQRVQLELFWVLFESLRISPSYELARRIHAGQVYVETDPDVANLADLVDAEALLSTFAWLGDVRHTFFMPWWRRKSPLFDEPHYRDALLKLQIEEPTKYLDQMKRRLNALHLKALHPAKTDWQIALLRMPPAMANAIGLSQDAVRHSPLPKQVDAKERINLENEVARDLRIGRLLAENAARGKFFSQEAVTAQKYDYAQIGTRLSGIATWEKANFWRAKL